MCKYTVLLQFLYIKLYFIEFYSFPILRKCLEDQITFFVVVVFFVQSHPVETLLYPAFVFETITFGTSLQGWDLSSFLADQNGFKFVLASWTIIFMLRLTHKLQFKTWMVLIFFTLMVHNSSRDIARNYTDIYVFFQNFWGGGTRRGLGFASLAAQAFSAFRHWHVVVLVWPVATPEIGTKDWILCGVNDTKEPAVTFQYFCVYSGMADKGPLLV